MGTRAFIAPLIQGLQDAKPQTLLEGIDALGHLSYYKKSEEAEAFILFLFKTYAQNELIVWKLIQACQAFSSEAIEDHLLILLKSSCQAHAVEAKRVLELRKKLRTR